MPSVSTAHPLSWARSLWAAAEPFTLYALFAPEARAAAAELGARGRSSFFAMRAAPLGRASGAVVAAAFHSMPPALFDRLSAVWESAEPEQLIEVHHGAVAQIAGRAFGDRIDLDRLSDQADVLSTVVAGLDTSGRPLAAGNQAIAAPTEPWARFWRAWNGLREYRGDGHIAALTAADLDVVESELLMSGWARDHLDLEMLRSSRELTDERWGAATEGLAARGLFSPDGRITDLGRELREQIEVQTDIMSIRPWRTLPAERCAEIFEFVADLSTRLIADGEMRAVTAVGAPWPPPPLS